MTKAARVELQDIDMAFLRIRRIVSVASVAAESDELTADTREDLAARLGDAVDLIDAVSGPGGDGA